MTQISIAASAFVGTCLALATFPALHTWWRWLRCKLRWKPRCEICGQKATARWCTLRLDNGLIDRKEIVLCDGCLKEQVVAHALEQEGGE